MLRIAAESALRAIVLRAGVVYGPSIKLIEAARWLMRKRLMAVWRRPTWVHLLSLPDFLWSVETAIVNEQTEGIFDVCDARPLLPQEFLDCLAAHWGCAKPWRLLLGAFYFSAILCEAIAAVFHTAAPLNRDILRMGLTSAVADTARMTRELIAKLAYPTLDEGPKLLRVQFLTAGRLDQRSQGHCL